MYIQQFRHLKKGQGGGGGGLGLFQNTMASPLALFYWNSFCQRNEVIVEVFNCHQKGEKITKLFYIWFNIFYKKYRRMTNFFITYMIHNLIWWNPPNDDCLYYIFLWMIAWTKIQRKNIALHNGMNSIIGKRNHTPFIECSPCKI
jgi:hypothetical protein